MDNLHRLNVRLIATSERRCSAKNPRARKPTTPRRWSTSRIWRTFINRPQPSTCVKSRTDFGFGEADHLCVRSQSLFKLHLDEAVLRQVVERDPLV
jgi:hypothetical protein